MMDLFELTEMGPRFLNKKEIKMFMEDDIIGINPYSEECLRINSYDLRVGRIYRHSRKCNLVTDLSSDSMELEEASKKESGYIIEPGNIYVIESMESVKIQNNIIGIVSPRSKLSRCSIFSSSLLVDSGYQGKLSMTMFSPNLYFVIPIGMRSFQILFSVINPDEDYMKDEKSKNTNQHERINHFVPDNDKEEI